MKFPLMGFFGTFSMSFCVICLRVGARVSYRVRVRKLLGLNYNVPQP